MPQDFALWHSAHWAWATAQEVGVLGLIRPEEDVSHFGKAPGSMGVQLRPESQTPAPERGYSLLSPVGGKIDSPRPDRMWLRVDHPCFSFPLRRSCLAPWGHSDRCGPSITRLTLVPFYSNQAAVIGLRPTQLPPAAAGRGSEPRTTHSLRRLAWLYYWGPCARPASHHRVAVRKRPVLQAQRASWRSL